MLYPILFMAIITALFTAILSFLNQSTGEAIRKNRDLELRRKILYVFNILPENATDDEVSERFTSSVSEEPYGEGKILYTLTEGGVPAAYAVPFDGPGLWGSITGYIGVKADLASTTGIAFITQSETPGLGGRIAEEPYMSQFRGVNVTERVGTEIIINRPAPGGNIDAIAGATQTSTFVKNMLNSDLIEFMDSRGGN